MIRALRNWWKHRSTVAYGPIERQRVAALLDRSYQVEMWWGDRFSSPLGYDPDSIARKILAIRSERVDILRRLGRFAEADQLEADTIMRCEWMAVRLSAPGVTREEGSP